MGGWAHPGWRTQAGRAVSAPTATARPRLLSDFLKLSIGRTHVGTTLYLLASLLATLLIDLVILFYYYILCLIWFAISIKFCSL